MFSMSLIAQRLQYERSRSILVNGYRYQDAMLLAEPSEMKNEVLYLSRGIPAEPARVNSRSGLVCVVRPEEFHRTIPSTGAFGCNCLILGTERSFYEVFNDVSTLLIQLREQMDVFRTAVYTRQSLQMLTEMVYDILGNPAYIVDSSFKVLAIDDKHDARELSRSWRRLEDEGYLPFDLVTNLINSGELRKMESGAHAGLVRSKYFYVPFINYNLRQKGRVRGHIYIAGIHRPILACDVELADHLGNLIQEALIRDPAFQNQRGDYYEHFMRDMISGKLVDRLHIQQQMHFLGIQPQDYHTLCVLHTSAEHTLSDDRIASQLERCCGATPVFYKDKIVGLFSHRAKPDPLKLEQALGSIHTELNCQVGVSDTFQGFYDFNTYYIQAEWALTAPALLPSLRNAGPIRYYRDYVSAHVLYSFSRQANHCAVLPPELELLRRYDEENHTELTVTLYRFLALERSMQETAKALFIHRNTLAYRIGKIHELCGFDLDNEAVRRRLILALELEELLRQKQT